MISMENTMGKVYGSIQPSQAEGIFDLTIGVLGQSHASVYGTLDELEEVIHELSRTLKIRRAFEEAPSDAR